MRFNLDPTRIVVQQPPQAPPEKPRLSISVTPAEIGLPHVVELLKQYGIQVTPQMAQQANGQAMVQDVMQQGNPSAPPASPPHGGAAPTAGPLSKHQMRNDGVDARMGGPDGLRQ